MYEMHVVNSEIETTVSTRELRAAAWPSGSLLPADQTRLNASEFRPPSGARLLSSRQVSEDPLLSRPDDYPNKRHCCRIVYLPITSSIRAIRDQ